jgi:hypothetical protein
VGYRESAQLIATLDHHLVNAETGTTIWVSDGIDSLHLDLLPSERQALAGVRQVIPAAEDSADEFDARVRAHEEVPPNANIVYAAEAYDAVVITALASLAAEADLSPQPISAIDDPAVIATYINDITRGGTRCTDFSSCRDIIKAGGDPDYDGVGGRYEFTDRGEPSEATYRLQTFTENGPDPTSFLYFRRQTTK